MRIDFNLSATEGRKFYMSCEAAIRNVAAGTKTATEYAGWEIMAESWEQVPVDTGTLASSAYFGVSRREDVSGYRYGAVLGYGEQGKLASGIGLGNIEWVIAPTNGVNPKSNLTASTYAGRVHEDLDMPHPRGGKAKFLEDPVRNWASGRYARTVMTYWKTAITTTNQRAYPHYNIGKRAFEMRFSKWPSYFHRYNLEKQSTGIQRGDEYVRKGESS